MEEETVGIVFLHHRTDPVTANNLQSFRDWNPDLLIVTISAGEAFPGGYAIRDFPAEAEKWERHTGQSHLQQRSADLLLYAWYRHRREHCDRWVIVEWDAFCAMRIADFFAHVWAFDVAGPTVVWRNREPGWPWFATASTLPADLHPWAVGVAPFCFILVRDAVLAAVVQRVPWAQLGQANCELRFGTLVHAAGFVPVANPLASWNIGWQPLPETTALGAGLWHPVKWLASRAVPTAREREFWVPPSPQVRPRMAAGEVGEGLAVITLWRGEWNAVQAGLLRWMTEENFPAGTQFVWVAPAGSATAAALDQGWAGIDARRQGHVCEKISPPAVAVGSYVQKHHLVAALYNEALRGRRAEWVIFVEDDVLPEAGWVRKLLAAMQAQPPETASIAAAYPRRSNADAICATDAQWTFLPRPAAGASGLTEALWTGGGFTIYRGAALRGAGPLHATTGEGQRWDVCGWDVNLGLTLHRQGYRIFVDTGIRAEHRCTDAW